ncbi:MAG: GlxA family transcriptional regulator [Ruegeria sp.]
MKSATNILQPEPRALKTAVLVLDECSTLSFASVVDPMRAANRLADRPAFDWDYVTATADPVRLSSALLVPGIPLATLGHCEFMIVIDGPRSTGHATPALLNGLRRIAATGAAVAGIDGGQWLLAEAGLLDGNSASPRPEECARFADRFPNVTLSDGRFTASGHRLTASGAVPTIDMMLHIMSARLGAGFAAQIAGLFAQDTAATPPKTPITAPHRHASLTEQANTLMAAALDDPMPLVDIAETLGTSPRTLQQQFRLRLNTTPQDHYLQLRLAEARRLVTDTDMSLMDVATATGFASQSSFARAFRTAHGLSARDLRQERSLPTRH